MNHNLLCELVHAGFAELQGVHYCVQYYLEKHQSLHGPNYMLRFNPKWDMHWLRTKQNREWFASKACSQNSGFSFGSF